MLNSINEIQYTYQIIQDYKFQHNIPIYQSLKTLKLTQRKYYYSLKEKQNNFNKKQNKINEITQRIKQICHETNFAFGIRKIRFIYYTKYQEQIPYELTRRIMRENKLNCQLKRYNKTRKRFYQPIIQKNLINQNFKSLKPFEKLFSDITEFKINNKKFYYSAVIDSYNNQILAFRISTKNNTNLLVKTLNKIKKPKNKLCIFHSDRGGNYTSHKFQKFLLKKKYISSMSLPANPKDNAVIENFFSILKGHLKNPTVYKLERFANYYNHNFILTKLNFKTPIQFLQQNNN